MALAGTVLAVAGLLAACAGAGVDVTNSAGDPVPGAGSSAPAGGGPAAEPESQPGAPRCPGRFAATGAGGLDCLGPGPEIDVFQVDGVVVVPVWASWCQPCREELPVIQEFHSSGANVIGVAAADNSAAAASLTEELELTFPSVQDPESTTRATLGWTALPATLVLRDGEVVGRVTGRIETVAQLEDLVRRAEEG